MTIPATMQAMVLKGHGDIDMIEWEEAWPVPQIEEGEVLIKVLATGMNNTDVNTRSGWYSKSVTDATTGDGFDELDDTPDNTWGGAAVTFPRIQGADVCGEVVAGPDHLIGKRVITDNWLRDWDDPMNMNATGYYGSEADGGYAQYCKIDARNVGVVDSDMSDAELATFSCSYTTAEGMLERANVGEGETVLITGASGGVGSALIQLANRRGAITIALASEAKHDDVRAVGAQHVLPRAPKDLKAALKSVIGTETVSVVADIVGGDYWPNLIDVLERGGRYTCSGAIAGPMVELDLRTMYLRDLTFTGSTILPTHIFTDLIGYIERREIKPLLAASYPLSDFHQAQRDFIAKKHTGNIVVIP